MANSNLISIDLFYKESKALITYESMNVIRTFEGKYGPKMKEVYCRDLQQILRPEQRQVQYTLDPYRFLIS